MRISHQHKFILFCNPKTGSDSLREMFDPYSDVRVLNNFKNQSEKQPFYTHISPQETKLIFQNLGWNYKDYYKIISTRNPFFRLISLFEMIYKRRPNIIKPSFKKWLINTKNNNDGGGGKDYHRWRKYGTYSLENLIFDENEEILVDKVVRLEDFNLEIPKLFKHLDLPQPKHIIKKNIGKKRKMLSDYYDDELIKLVEERYFWELNKFNYKF